MTVSNDHPALQIERVRELLLEWFTKRRTNTVAFRENANPKSDPNARYAVAYEAIFEPSSLDQARVELWVTPDGQVSIGFETRKRIAERLGVKYRGDRFAAGHEPQQMSTAGLIALLDMIATGQIAISAAVIPLFGLVSTNAVVLREALESLVSNGYRPINWLQAVTRFEPSYVGNLLQFRRW